MFRSIFTNIDRLLIIDLVQLFILNESRISLSQTYFEMKNEGINASSESREDAIKLAELLFQKYLLIFDESKELTDQFKMYIKV